MSMIRLQHHTPDIYTRESRDFQLLLRLYDCVINGIEYDISTIRNILDTQLCKSNMIPLLQTKLGFFTKGQYNDEEIRYILSGFKDIIKNKGSLKSIQYLMSVYLKLKNITSPLSVYYINEDKTLSNGFTIPAYSLVIEIRSNFTDTALLEEVLRYILPAGIGYYIYFYQTILEYDEFLYDDNAILLFTSVNINSRLRGSNQIFNSGNTNENLLPAENSNFLNELDNRVIGAINSMNVAPITETNEMNTVSTSLLNPSAVEYTSVNDPLFIGLYEGNIDIDGTNYTDIVGNNIKNGNYFLYRKIGTDKFKEFLIIETNNIVDFSNPFLKRLSTTDNSIFTVSELDDDPSRESQRIVYNTTSDIEKNDIILYRINIKNLNDYTIGYYKYPYTEDFSSYTVGTNSYFNENKNDFIFSEPSNNIQYNISNENNNKYLSLKNSNNSNISLITKAYTTENWKISMKARLKSNEITNKPSLTIRPFYSINNTSGYFYFDSRYGVRLVTGSSSTLSNSLLMKTNGQCEYGSTNYDFKPNYNEWYNIQLENKSGNLIIKCWSLNDPQPEGDSGAYIIDWMIKDKDNNVLENNGNFSKVQITSLGRQEEMIVDIDDIQISNLDAGGIAFAIMNSDTNTSIVTSNTIGYGVNANDTLLIEGTIKANGSSLPGQEEKWNKVSIWCGMNISNPENSLAVGDRIQINDFEVVNLTTIEFNWKGNYDKIPDELENGDVFYLTDTSQSGGQTYLGNKYYIKINNQIEVNSYPLSLFVKEVLPDESNQS